MATNYILPFAQGGGANVQTQATYNADSQRAIGNQPGTARSDFVNKCLRQLSAICAGIGQFIADNQSSDVTDDLVAATLSTMLRNAVKASAQSPAGTVVWVPGTSPLASTVKVNGSLLNRVTYGNLYAYGSTSGNMAASDGAWVSGQFSPGDGTTTFRIPDLRGYVLRAWDDGRGIDASRTIGSVQADALLTHGHTVTDSGHSHGASVGDPGHAHLWGHNNQSGVNPGGGNYGGTSGGYAEGTSTSTTGISVGIATGFTGISVNNYVGQSEVRVKNIALMPIIYY